MLKCPYCRRPVPENDSRCPACNNKIRQSNRGIKKGCFSGCLFVVLFATATVLFSGYLMYSALKGLLYSKYGGDRSFSYNFRFSQPGFSPFTRHYHEFKTYLNRAKKYLREIWRNIYDFFIPPKYLTVYDFLIYPHTPACRKA